MPLEYNEYEVSYRDSTEPNTTLSGGDTQPNASEAQYTNEFILATDDDISIR